jgi:hypothetical protein
MRTALRVYALPILLLVVGAVLALGVVHLPRYRDPNWADRFKGVEVALENADRLSREWHAAREAALTNRDRYFDFGLGMTVLGVSVASLLAVLRVRKVADFQALLTPRVLRTFYVGASAAWLSFVPAFWAYLLYTFRRGDYPWWADNVAIPAGGAVFLAFWGAVIVLWVVHLSAGHASLPVHLWARPIVGSAWVVGAATLIATGLCLALLVMGVFEMFFIVPSAVAMLYMLLCCRAAASATSRAA